MNEVAIRRVEPDNYQPIISVVDEWWCGRPMSGVLPKLFFIPFNFTGFTAVGDGQIFAFLIGFVAQTYPDQAYVHFLVCIRHDVKRDWGVSSMNISLTRPPRLAVAQ